MVSTVHQYHCWRRADVDPFSSGKAKKRKSARKNRPVRSVQKNRKTATTFQHILDIEVCTCTEWPVTHPSGAELWSIRDTHPHLLDRCCCPFSISTKALLCEHRVYGSLYTPCDWTALLQLPGVRNVTAEDQPLDVSTTRWYNPTTQSTLILRHNNTSHFWVIPLQVRSFLFGVIKKLFRLVSHYGEQHQDGSEVRYSLIHYSVWPAK